MLKVVEGRDRAQQEIGVGTLDELAREGARRMLRQALAAEVDAYVERHQGELDERGHRLVMRKGKAKARQVTCGAGTLEVEAPRVNDKRVDEQGQRQRFTSQILPPYMRNRSAWASTPVGDCTDEADNGHIAFRILTGL